MARSGSHRPTGPRRRGMGARGVPVVSPPALPVPNPALIDAGRSCAIRPARTSTGSRYRYLIMLSTPGPITTMNSAGNRQSSVGKRIFTGIF